MTRKKRTGGHSSHKQPITL